MTSFHDSQAARQRRWMRPNAHLYVRQDAYRFMAPGAASFTGRDAVKHFGPCRQDGDGTKTRERKYSPTQPRILIGRPGAGRWTDGSSSSGQSAGGASGGVVAIGEDGDVPFQVVDMEVDGIPFLQVVGNPIDGTAILSETASKGDEGERHSVLLPDGNLRTFFNSGNIQKVVDGAGQLISETAWTSGGPQTLAAVPRTLLQLPLAGAAAAQIARVAVQKTIEAGLALYTWLSSRDRSDKVAVYAFRAREFQFESGLQPVLSSVRTLSREEAANFCKFLSKVQEFTDDGVKKAIADGIPRGAVFGTKVHKFIADKINGMGEPDFVAEISVLKSLEAGASLPDLADIKNKNYGKLNTVRIDGFEYLADLKTVCIYDPKTEKARLTFSRMKELATTAKLNFPKAIWFVVMETKPSVQ